LIIILLFYFNLFSASFINFLLISKPIKFLFISWQTLATVPEPIKGSNINLDFGKTFKISSTNFSGNALVCLPLVPTGFHSFQSNTSCLFMVFFNFVLGFFANQ